MAMAIIASICTGHTRAEKLKFVHINDSTTYVRINDPDTVALTLDIKTDYRLPYEGINPANRLKMADMLMNITGVNFDEEGYPAPSDVTKYDGGKWVPANEENTREVMRLLDSDYMVLTRLWSESPVIEPVYEDEEHLSMLASNYVYTGGVHGIYWEYCVNYSLRGDRFVTLKDIFPGLDTPEGKKKYEEKLTPILTKKAKEYMSSAEDGMSLLVDEVTPTSNFAFTKDGIVLRYQPYEIAPWAAGVVEIPLSYGEIKQITESVR